MSLNETANALGLGLEFLLIKDIALRIGVKQTGDDYVHPSFGFGLNFKHLVLDYAFTSVQGGGLKDIGLHHIGLSFKFGKIVSEPVTAKPVTPVTSIAPITRGTAEKPLIPKTTVQINLAVADFAGKNVSQADASIVADFLRTELVNTGKFNVVEKANMDKILAEAAFQQSGCTTSECAVQIGNILNVKQMVVGSLSKLMDTYYITVNVVEVETGKIIVSYDQEATSAKELRIACKTLAQKIAQ